jgi:hypothetical protein
LLRRAGTCPGRAGARSPRPVLGARMTRSQPQLPARPRRRGCRLPIGNNGSCRKWLFGMDFGLAAATHWGWATGIPAGGHLGRGFPIEASDDLLEDGSYRVFSGTVNGEVAKVLITLSDNEHVAIKPRAPSERLRRKVVWLRNVRYFVGYYPPEGFVTGVATFNASGQLLYRDKSFKGP